MSNQPHEAIRYVKIEVQTLQLTVNEGPVQ